MARNLSHDDSTTHLRRGFKAGTVVVTLCAGVLLAQDVLPAATLPVATPSAMSAAACSAATPLVPTSWREAANGEPGLRKR